MFMQTKIEIIKKLENEDQTVFSGQYKMKVKDKESKDVLA